MSQPLLFGVRHLSPGASWHLRQKLDELKPKLVLVEGPSDLSELMESICLPKSKPPIAIMAYTKESPIRTILYPLAEYSPEYQAILWAHQHNVPCRFFDLPAGAFLSMQRAERAIDEATEGITTEYVYRKLSELGDEDHDSFWERNFEHLSARNSYHQGVAEFGRQLRSHTEKSDTDFAENIVREAYMKRQIAAAIAAGIPAEKIVCVCGSYHVGGLETNEPMTNSELAALPLVPCNSTLMPYSYYRLSTRSGYGAGNKAPAYFELLWKAMNKKKLEEASFEYLVRIARYQRKNGNLTSSAEVIEAVRLARTLSALRGCDIPCLRDLHDAATTCMGHGNFSEIALAVADTEIGTRIGSLPEGVSRTSIQDDFYRELKNLRLENYRTMVVQPLALDLRENLRVKSEKSAFMDLNRSLFLHRVRVLGIHFATWSHSGQDKATWAENWALQWTPEAEIEIVEVALLGETIATAAAFSLKERAEASENIRAAVGIVADSFLCGMPEAVVYAVGVLQRLAVDAVAIADLAATAQELSLILRYGSLRPVDSSPVQPLLSQLFLRACLTLEGACVCDNLAAKSITEAMDTLNSVQLNHDFLQEAQWLSALKNIAKRDDLNTKCSGFAAAILLERGLMDSEELAIEVSRRLSPAVPADLGAGWFEGLAQKNRYSLIARLSLWEQLSTYLDALDDEDFKRSLVFLRRAFADFSASEKSDIAENMGEIWGLSAQDTADALMRQTTPEEQELLGGLDDFDFGDI